MNRYVIFIFLLMASLNIRAQEKAFSKYVFSLGYGYFDLLYKYQNFNLNRESKTKIGNFSDHQRSLIGPLYAKVETNLSRKIGLSICIGYEQFSYSTNYNMYRVSHEGNSGYGYFAGTKDFEGSNYSTLESRWVEEMLSVKSFASNLRINYYMLDNERTQFYIGIGTGYRMVLSTHKTTVREQYPELDKDFYVIGNYIEDFQGLRLGAEITLGFRHFFYDNLGLYAELGFAKSLIQRGLCYKIN